QLPPQYGAVFRGATHHVAMQCKDAGVPAMTDAPMFCLARFREAQVQWYATALRELRAGKKRTHWVWFVFPQLQGLGSSANAEKYGLSGLAEARAYLADALLGQRLRECTAAMLAHQSLGAS